MMTVDDEILQLFREYPGAIITHGLLCRKFFGHNPKVTKRVLYTRIANVRRKLDDNETIVVHKGIGWSLQLVDQPQQGGESD
jgi:DNA-binding response OmpR family regulator